MTKKIDSSDGIIHGNDKIITVVNELVDYYGTGSDKVIQILTGIQNKLNYLPDEALIEVSRLTDITPGQISEISTFYSQFRHKPTGKYIIQFCFGTTCFLKGSREIKKAFSDYLKIEEGKNCSPDNLFSIEDVECLGVCAIAPALRIGDKIYGNLSVEDASRVIDDFLESMEKKPKPSKKSAHDNITSEIRVGIGSCCVARGSKEVLAEIVAYKESKNLPVLVKPVGCTGACGYTPILDIVSKEGNQKRYVAVNPQDVGSIMEENFGNDKNIDNTSDDARGIMSEKLDDYLAKQVRIATYTGGILSPVSLNEFISKGGLESFKKLVNEKKRSQIIDKLTLSGLKEKSSSKLVGEDLWLLKSDENSSHTIICYSEENDSGSFKDRMLLETFPNKIIEGMLIIGLATGIEKAIFHISEMYPLANRRIKNAISQYIKAGYLGYNILDSGFSFEIIVIEGPGDFMCGERDSEFAGVNVLMLSPETFCRVPNIFRNGNSDENKSFKIPNTLVVGLTGKVETPGVIEVLEGTSIGDIIDHFGGLTNNKTNIKAVHVGGLAGCFIPKELFDMPLDYDIFKNNSLFLGPGNIEVIDETDSIVDLTLHFADFARRQSCGKCTICRAGTKRMYDIIQKIKYKNCTKEELAELELHCTHLKKGSLCGLGKNAPNAIVTALKYFRKEFEEGLLA
jgi:NADH:ubiquinone oxidoreductase subunit F (NADH-binding)/NADH:ubiquinone oxidoreductase subunit E